MELSTCETIMNTNMLSHIAATKAALSGMKQRKFGQIINVQSVSGIFGTPVRTLYCASKFGFSGFGKALRSEVMADGIHILQVYPGYVSTNISKNAMSGSGDKFGKVDSDIKNGMSVGECCDQILRALTVGRTEYVVGNLLMQITPIIAQFDFLCNLLGNMMYKR